MDGFGTLKVKGKIVYEGEFNNAKFHGKGKFQHPDGYFYEG